MSPVAIVGAGITGLTAALHLQKAGIEVAVYEASGRVGGPIQSTTRDGYLAESGPNTLLDTAPQIRELIRDAGLESEMLYSDPKNEKRYLVRDGQPVAMPDSILAFATTRLFSTRAKLRLLREPFIAPAPEEVEETVEQFVLRRLGQEFLDYAIDPLVGGIYAGNPARLSVPHAFPKLRALELRYGSLLRGQFLGARDRKRRAETSKSNAKKISFVHGLESLPAALQRKLGQTVRLRTPVRAIDRTASGWRVTAQTADGSLESNHHRAVLLAVPASKLAKIDLISDWPAGLRALGGIHYPPVASVVLGFKRQDVSHPLDGFGVLIPKTEGFSILGTLFSSSLFPGRAPEGCVTLSSFIGGMRAPALALRPADELVETARRDLSRLLGIKGSITFEQVQVFPQAIPQYEAGFGLFKKQMESIERTAPGVFLAGHVRDGISLSDCILAGNRTAQRIVEHLHQTNLSTKRPSKETVTT